MTGLHTHIVFATELVHSARGHCSVLHWWTAPQGAQGQWFSSPRLNTGAPPKHEQVPMVFQVKFEQFWEIYEAALWNLHLPLNQGFWPHTNTSLWISMQVHSSFPSLHKKEWDATSDKNPVMQTHQPSQKQKGRALQIKCILSPQNKV